MTVTQALLHQWVTREGGVTSNVNVDFRNHLRKFTAARKVKRAASVSGSIVGFLRLSGSKDEENDSDEEDEQSDG
jgi:hypothetical protein